ncbi:MAG: cytochrome c biogenesis protein ResB [Candidatus Latescibacteria bacterium]|nr:cytochrome c biogenesis protein ResB [Candidatus Latescibacterota bacterium]
MTDKKKKTTEPGLFQTLSSLQFGLVVLIAIACVAVVGTIIPQGRHPSFYTEHYGAVVNFLVSIFRFDNTYQSPLFLGLIMLFGLNLILCSMVKFPALLRRTFNPDTEPGPERLFAMPVSATVRGVSIDDVAHAFAAAGFPLRRVGESRLFGAKGTLGYLGAFTVHASLLIFLAGGITSLMTGFRGYIRLGVGESTDAVILSETLSAPLGFEVALDSFAVSFYEDFPGRPKSYVSSVTVTRPDGESFTKDIMVNTPLMIDNFTIFQSSYGVDESSDGAAALDDTARVAIRLKGTPENMPPIVTLDMVRGDTYAVPGFGDSITVGLAELHRDFKVSGGGSRGENPAALIDVMVNGAQRWGVYTFMNFPGLNMPMFDDLMLSFTLNGLVHGGGEPGMSGKKSYYTVLGVVRDRGIPLIWTASVVMMIGLFLSFYLRPRRVWALYSDGAVIVGGTVKGNPDSFRDFFQSTIAKIRRENS